MPARTAHLISERALQDAIVTVARLNRWFVYHPYDSRRSTPGWPDLVLIRTPDIIFAELKSESGKLTGDQARVLELLEGCGEEVHCWRPSNLDAAIERLTRPR